MASYQKVHTHWTRVRSQAPDGTLRETVCCCEAPGAWRTTCMIATGNKTPCRCACHKAAPPVTRKKRGGPSDG